MASSEQTFREELCTSLRACHRDIQVLYINDRFHAGRSDLYIKHPEYPGIWLELKFTTLQKKTVQKYGVNLLLTKAQRVFLERMLKAGDMAGWAACVKVEGGEWMLFVGTDPYAARALKCDFVQSRSVGGMWSAPLLLNKIAEGVAAWRGE